jgi:hypothetical protein
MRKLGLRGNVFFQMATFAHALSGKDHSANVRRWLMKGGGGTHNLKCKCRQAEEPGVGRRLRA